jgi:exopolysaccharide production protein ExoQ
LNPQSFKNLIYLAQKLELVMTIAILVIIPTLRAQSRVVEVGISVVIYVYTFAIFIQNWKRIIYAFPKDWVLMTFTLLAVFSILWSASPSDTYSELKFLLRATVVGLYLSVKYTPKELLRLFAGTCFVAIFASCFMSILLPMHGLHNYDGVLVWKGIFTHKQGLGTYMGFSASLFMCRLMDAKSSRWVNWAGTLLSWALIFLSASKTGLIIGLFSVALLPLYKLVRQQGKFRSAMLILALLVLGSGAAFLTMNFETVLVDYLGKDINFNGRLPVWVMSIAKGLERPWFGYGFNGFWTSDVSDIVLFNSWAVRDSSFRERSITFHSHNGFVDLFLQFGFVGMTLFFLSFATFLGRVVKLTLVTRSVDYFWMFQFIGIFLVNNVSESMIILQPGYLWIIYVSLAYASALQTYRMDKKIPARMDAVEPERLLSHSVKP